MPITLFLAGQAFELEEIESMSAAFVAACDAPQLKVGKDPATRFVAEKVKVIELAQRGIRDPDVLRKMTLKEFGLSDESASGTKRVRASGSRALHSGKLGEKINFT
jgi:hypothetical protein